MERKIAVDLFSGTGSATKAFRESEEWEVFDVDIREVFEVNTDRGWIYREKDLKKDIREVRPGELPQNPDFLWASPPCNTFSVASLGHYWGDFPMPKQEGTVEGVELVFYTLYLIESIDPEYWFMENPTAQLRNIIGKPSGRVTYCQYGHDSMKQTDLWGDHPNSMSYESCKNGDDCHVSAPRGASHQGTQATDKTPAERAKIPYELSKAIFEAVENPTGENQSGVKDFL